MNDYIEQLLGPFEPKISDIREEDRILFRKIRKILKKRDIDSFINLAIKYIRLDDKEDENSKNQPFICGTALSDYEYLELVKFPPYELFIYLIKRNSKYFDNKFIKIFLDKFVYLEKEQVYSKNVLEYLFNIFYLYIEIYRHELDWGIGEILQNYLNSPFIFKIVTEELIKDSDIMDSRHLVSKVLLERIDYKKLNKYIHEVKIAYVKTLKKYKKKKTFFEFIDYEDKKGRPIGEYLDIYFPKDKILKIKISLPKIKDPFDKMNFIANMYFREHIINFKTFKKQARKLKPFMTKEEQKICEDCIKIFKHGTFKRC